MQENTRTLSLDQLALADAGSRPPFGIGMPTPTKGPIDYEKLLKPRDVPSGLPNVIGAVVNLSGFLKAMGWADQFL